MSSSGGLHVAQSKSSSSSSSSGTSDSGRHIQKDHKSGQSSFDHLDGSNQVKPYRVMKILDESKDIERLLTDTYTGGSGSDSDSSNNYKSNFKGKDHKEGKGEAGLMADASRGKGEDSSNSSSQQQSRVGEGIASPVLQPSTPPITPDVHPGAFSGTGTGTGTAMSAASSTSSPAATVGTNAPTSPSPSTPSSSSSSSSSRQVLPKAQLSRPQSAQRRRPSLTPGLEQIPEEYKNSATYTSVHSAVHSPTKQLFHDHGNSNKISSSSSGGSGSGSGSAGAGLALGKTGSGGSVNTYSASRNSSGRPQLDTSMAGSNRLLYTDVTYCTASSHDPRRPLSALVHFLLTGAGAGAAMVSTVRGSSGDDSENIDSATPLPAATATATATATAATTAAATFSTYSGSSSSATAYSLPDTYGTSTIDMLDMLKEKYTDKYSDRYDFNDVHTQQKSTPYIQPETITSIPEKPIGNTRGTFDTKGLAMPLAAHISAANDCKRGEDDENDDFEEEPIDIDRITELGLGLGQHRHRRRSFDANSSSRSLSLGLGGVSGSSLHSVLGGGVSNWAVDHGVGVDPSPLFGLSPQTNDKHNNNLRRNHNHRGNRHWVSGDDHSNGNNQKQGRADTAFQAQQEAPWISAGLSPQSLIFELERAFPITRIRISGFGYNSVKIQLGRQVSGISHVSIVGPAVSATANDEVTVIDFTPSVDANTNTYHAAMNVGAGSFAATRGASGSCAGGSGSGSGSDSRGPVTVTGETNSTTKSKGNNNISAGVSGGAGIAANHITIHLWNTNTNMGSITTNCNYNSNLASDFFVVFEISVFYDDRSSGSSRSSSSSSSSSGWDDTKKGKHK